ncbi:MAG: hypothetical protein VX294_13665 [Candidatus Latescibacterota bacterium]|nr:hypothetical protein [Candidatus Latescibacterota bacterium]
MSKFLCKPLSIFKDLVTLAIAAGALIVFMSCIPVLFFTVFLLP